MAKEYKSKEYISDSDDSDNEGQYIKSIFDKDLKSYKITKLNKVPTNFEKTISKKNKKLVLLRIPKNINIEKIEIKKTLDSLLDKENKVNYNLIEDNLVNTKNLELIVKKTNGDDVMMPIEQKNEIKVYNVIENVEIPNIDYDSCRVPREDVIQLSDMKQEHFATGYDSKDYKKDEVKKEKKEKKDKKVKKEKKSKK